MKTIAFVVIGLLTASFAGCLGGENRATLGSGVVSGADADGDRVPDALESVLCGREVTADALSSLGGAGRCASPSDYVPPLVEQDFVVPTTPVLGPDADHDGIPSTVKLDGTRVTVSTAAGSPLVTSSPSPAARPYTLDPDDRDANTPVPYVIMVPLIPMGARPGADADHDGFPKDVEVMRANLTFDRRVGIPETLNPSLPSTGSAAAATGSPLKFESAPSAWVDVDPDDANAANPVASTVRSDTAIPTDVRLGPDHDHDDLPATVIVSFGYLIVDRTVAGGGGTASASASPVRFEDAGSQSEPVDPDDSDADNPAAVKFGPVSAPISAERGPDADGDNIPASVSITWLDVTVDRRSIARSHASFGMHEETTPLDLEDDTSRNDPVPFDAIDHDGDSLPDEAEPWVCKLQDRSTPADGKCVRSDGSGADGSGTNYVPPATGDGWRLS